MANKSKFQIAQSLSDKLSRISSGMVEYEPDFENIDHAFIIGFRCSKQNNFLGLTSDYKSYNAGLAVLGIAYFRAKPISEQDINQEVQSIVEFSSSRDGSGCHKSDKDNNLFLICYPNEDSKILSHKLFDSSTGGYLSEQPAILTVDESKIYTDSIVAHLVCPLKLSICDSSSKLLGKNEIATNIDTVIESFVSKTENITLNLKESNYTTKLSTTSTGTTESLYDNLEAPSDITSMGDYLPQMSKKEKETAIVKWRNKLKNQRAPITVYIEHLDYGFADQADLPKDIYGFTLDIYVHLQANNPLTKSMRYISYQIRHCLNLLKEALLTRGELSNELAGLKSCTFNPKQIGHLVSAIYEIHPTKPDYEYLKGLRRKLHQVYMVPLDRPAFRYSQRVRNVKLAPQDSLDGYLCNVHSSILSNSGIAGGSRSVIEGTYAYHHYMQSRISDNGWGCAYRSLQTIISWFKNQGYIYSPDVEMRASNSKDRDKSRELRSKLHQESRVPTHEEIQTVLVDVGDKQPSFIGSQKWIGSQEVCYVLNHLYDLDSKFISVSSGSELVYKARDLSNHFSNQSTPVMIGGGVLAHTIIGVDFQEKSGDVSYLILDPHYTGPEDLATILKKGWCGWKKNSFWDKNAFYNLCLPQRPIGF